MGIEFYETFKKMKIRKSNATSKDPWTNCACETLTQPEMLLCKEIASLFFKLAKNKQLRPYRHLGLEVEENP